MIAAMITALFICFLSNRACRFGLVDRASSSRKLHDGAIPLVGGLAIFAGFILSLWVLKPNAPLEGLLPPALLLIAIGVIDDRYDLPYTARFSAQIVAGLMITLGSGVVVYSLGDLVWPDYEILLGVAAIPFTIICIVGLANAFNMADGTDGLVGTLSAVALFGLALTAYLNGQEESAETILLVSASVVAFLCFNARLPGRSRARVFLGDAGSTLLGFLVTWFNVSLSQGEHAAIQPVTALWFVALPFFDMVVVMGRRILSRRSPFEADREHLHHAFLLAGFSVEKTVLILGAIATLLAGIGIGGLYLGIPEHIMFYMYLSLLGG
jgi:UDP-GlcNAc:undecaprenyl-phosphate GlcNAc-1-phosphate transferase